VQPKSDGFSCELEALASDARRLAESMTDIDIRFRLIEIADDLRVMVSAQRKLNHRPMF